LKPGSARIRRKTKVMTGLRSCAAGALSPLPDKNRHARATIGQKWILIQTGLLCQENAKAQGAAP